MSLLGSFGKALIGGVTGFATGGIAGAGVGLVRGFTGGGGAPPPGPLPALPFNTGYGSLPGVNMPFQVNGPGGVPLPGFNPKGITVGAGGTCPRGYHLNKHALAASKSHGAVPAHSMCVRNRKINPLNPRAVTRSLRRLKRARKIVAKLHAFGTSRAVARVGGRGHRPGCGCVVCRRR